MTLMGSLVSPLRELLRIVENFPKLMADTKPHIQEAQPTISRVNAKANKQKTNNNKKKPVHIGISYSN